MERGCIIRFNNQQMTRYNNANHASRDLVCSFQKIQVQPVELSKIILWGHLVDYPRLLWSKYFCLRLVSASCVIHGNQDNLGAAENILQDHLVGSPTLLVQIKLPLFSIYFCIIPGRHRTLLQEGRSCRDREYTQKLFQEELYGWNITQPRSAKNFQETF